MFILCPASTTQTLLVFVATAADASLPSSAAVALKTAAAAANITAAGKLLFPLVVLSFPFLFFPSPPLLACLDDLQVGVTATSGKWSREGKLDGCLTTLTLES